MKLTNLKLIFRNFWKNKTTSAINIIGFAFSISICAIITIYVLHETSYDKFQKNYNNIYRITNAETNEAHVDNTIKEEILKNLPEVDEYSHLLLSKTNGPIQYNEKITFINYLARSDNRFFNMFTFQFLFGNPSEPFDQNLNSIVISESISKKLFGDQNPVGKKVILLNGDECIITAVFKDLPATSCIQLDVIRNEAYEISQNNMVHCNNGKCEYKRNVFVLLNDKINIPELTKKIDKQLADKDKFLKKVNFQPFKEIYLFDNTDNNYLKKGNLKLIKLLSGIALITLLLACFNYINLSVAQYKKRIKEVGIRKTIGASRMGLIRSFLTESAIITWVSLFIAMIITGIVLPVFSSVFNVQLNVSELIKPVHFAIMGTIMLALGLINGLSPALIITSFNPVNLIQKKAIKIGEKTSLINILTIFQFTVSIILIICVISIFKQLSYIKHKDLGFKDSYLVKLTTYHISNFDVMKSELLQNPLITSASYSSGIPGTINWGRGAGLDADEKYYTASVIGSDMDLAETCGFDIIEGRNFLESEKEKACMINETAMHKFGWKTWQGKHFARWENSEGYEVVGLVKDFHFGSLYEKIEPLVISFEDFQKSFLTVRISGKNVSSAIDYIKKTWDEIEPNVPIDYVFYDAWFDSMYKKEEQMAKMVTTFAILSIVISCLGIFGQVILNTTNRIKEIGIRKVNGATTNEIVNLINKKFVTWVLISLVLSIPSGSLIITKWLGTFAYHTDVSTSVLVLSGLLTFVITLVTVSWQSWSAARRNPVEALRYE